MIIVVVVFVDLDGDGDVEVDTTFDDQIILVSVATRPRPCSRQPQFTQATWMSARWLCAVFNVKAR